jgi:hypothetical protein
MPDGEQNPVLAYLKNMGEEDEDGIVLLSTGVRARINPVGATVIEEATAAVPAPLVPTFYNEDKGREEENPNHPDYLRALSDYNRKQTRVATDIMIMLGISLVDPVPTDGWLDRLRFLAKRGSFDLSGYDLDDPLDVEFLYKKTVAVGSADLILVGRKAGLNQDDIKEAAKHFKS